ncbi:unnamed protein product [Agarophyton chilense]
MFISVCFLGIFAVLVTIADTQQPFSNARGRGTRAFSPLPPPTSISSAGLDPECLGLTFRTINGRCTSQANAALGEARRAQFSYFNVNSAEFGGEDLPSPRLVSNIVVEQDGSAVVRPITSATSALDLSTVYGPDVDRAANLRVTGDCRLKTLDNFLPLNDANMDNSPPNTGSRFFFAGDTRSNETPMLTVMHTIWVREHNRICEVLESDSDFGITDPDELYEMARAVNIAEYQKIVYNEWLPAILGSTLSTYSGYDLSVDPTISVELLTV